jgi:hypothetical protein
LVAHNFYKAKEPKVIDLADIPDMYKPEFALKQANRKIPSTAGPKLHTRPAPKPMRASTRE